MYMRGEVRFKYKRWTFYLYWPSFIKTNVDVGLKADTRFIVKWFNEWTEFKSKSVAILVIGFGVGVERSYEPHPNY